LKFSFENFYNLQAIDEQQIGLQSSLVRVVEKNNFMIRTIKLVIQSQQLPIYRDGRIYSHNRTAAHWYSLGTQISIKIIFFNMCVWMWLCCWFFFL